MTADDTSPLAFIYDRNATRSRAILDMRLTGCHAYAERHGWHIAGRWIDCGDDALGDNRPQFAALLTALLAASATREAICLVHNWGRLSHDDDARILQQIRVAQAGGYTATTFDESDKRARHSLAGPRAADPGSRPGGWQVWRTRRGQVGVSRSWCGPPPTGPRRDGGPWSARWSWPRHQGLPFLAQAGNTVVTASGQPRGLAE